MNNDLILRADAIAAIEKAKNLVITDSPPYDSLQRVEKFIRAIPSANGGQGEGFNGCISVAADACEYLAKNERPYGGQSLYNSEHLYQIANELRKTMLQSPAHAPVQDGEGKNK